MKFLSEKTGKEYASVQECLMAEEEWEAEQAAKKAAEEKALAEAKAKKEVAVAERKAEAEKVETARQELIKAQKNYYEVLGNFCKKYGAYHYTLKSSGTFPDIWDALLNTIWL